MIRTQLNLNFRGLLGRRTKRLSDVLLGAALVCLSAFTLNAQTEILQQDATLTAGIDFADGDIYTDSGGSAGNYTSDEASTLTLCADPAVPGSIITVDFTAFEVEASDFSSCFDNLTVTGDTGGGDATYSGDDSDGGAGLSCTDATDAAGNPTLGPFSSAPDGCLTFFFDSDASVTDPGWVADITVNVPPPPAEIIQQEATLTAGIDFISGDIYTDSGGSAANYTSNEASTLVLCADAGNILTVDFTAFEVEASDFSSCFDFLTVTGDTGGGDATYAGDDSDGGAGLSCTDATDAAGNPTLGPFTSEEGGCLTFFFDSDASVTDPGWVATLTLAPPPPPTEIIQQDATLFAGADFNTGDIYTDSGGSAGNYTSNEASTLTLCADPAVPGSSVTVDFTAFEVEASTASSCFDNLTVTGDTGGGDATYSGDDSDGGAGLNCTDATDAAGNPTLGPFTSAPDGCLTFFFDSDGSVTDPGWVADITVNIPPPPAEIIQQEATLIGGTDFQDGDIYTDSGGSGANYTSNEATTLNLCAEPGFAIVVDFTSFEVEASTASSCFDNLTVTGDTNGGDGTYSGDDSDGGAGLNCTDATDAAGNPTLGPFTSAPGGCLTFFFDSDGSVTDPGWTATISIIESLANPPIAVCQDITVNLDDNGDAPAITGMQIDGGSSSQDGNTITLTTDSTTPFTCDDIGTAVVTLTVTDDGNGLTATCVATVTIADGTAPTAVCLDGNVILDEDGNGEIEAETLDGGSFDNCTAEADLVLSLSGISQFTCGSATSGTVILEVTDEAGNTGTCTATVTVADDIAPEIQCRQPVSTSTTPGDCGAFDLIVLPPFILNDNCDLEDVTVSRTPAGDDFAIGTTTLTWTVSDGSGNESTCESLVIVADEEAPTITGCSTQVEFLEPNSCNAQVIVTAEDVADNCGVASIQGTGIFTLPIGIYDNPITITDVNGNVTVYEYTIIVHDVTLPEFQNCPESVLTVQAGSDGTADYPGAFPFATDNCGTPTVTNDLSADGLPMGSTDVTFTAEDTYGNTAECVVSVEVTGGISLHPAGDIESSLAEEETTQNVAWNALNAATDCEMCAETDMEGFRYVGTWWGHQYFLADDQSLTRAEAEAVAEGYDAHLAVINDAAENSYLTEALSSEIRSAWIGLLPQQNADGNWTFAWDNGDTFDYSAVDFTSVNEDTRIILGNDGTWKNATAAEDKYFLLERPCVSFEQTGPTYQTTEEAEPVMLRSGDAWPQGTYEVTYAVTDMCGTSTTMTFDVDVLPETAAYCTTAGADNGVWIEQVVFHELTSNSAGNEGYADFTEEVTDMNIGDGTVLLNLTAGGNDAENVLYWNVFLDRNNDGDFYDAGELIFAEASETAIQANVSLPVEAVADARLRVMVSRYAFAAPCGDTYVGETEDYRVNLTVPQIIFEHEKPVADKGTSVFPNPAKNRATLTMQSFIGQNVSVTIFDNFGKAVQYSRIDDVANNVTLNTERLTNGVYHVTVVGADELPVTVRMVVSR